MRAPIRTRLAAACKGSHWSYLLHSLPPLLDADTASGESPDQLLDHQPTPTSTPGPRPQAFCACRDGLGR